MIPVGTIIHLDSDQSLSVSLSARRKRAYRVRKYVLAARVRALSASPALFRFHAAWKNRLSGKRTGAAHAQPANRFYPPFYPATGFPVVSKSGTEAIAYSSIDRRRDGSQLAIKDRGRLFYRRLFINTHSHLHLEKLRERVLIDRLHFFHTRVRQKRGGGGKLDRNPSGRFD